MRPWDVLSLGILRHNQWKTPEQIRELQDRKLMRLIHFAYQRVPYYRELFDSAYIKPEDIRGVEDLKHIPVSDLWKLVPGKGEGDTAE